jgi:hypothetical protein
LDSSDNNVFVVNRGDYIFIVSDYEFFICDFRLIIYQEFVIISTIKLLNLNYERVKYQAIFSRGNC